MTISFKDYFLKRLNEADAPPVPDPSAAPPQGGDPTGDMPPPPPGGGGSDPLGGPGGAASGGGVPRKAIKITTVWDVLKHALGISHEHEKDDSKPVKPAKEIKQSKSLIQ